MMKISIKHIVLFLCSLSLFSCKKDNYDAPGSQLSGRLVYKGVPINVEYNQVSYELYQFGFGKVGSMNGTFDQDGKYSMLLFDGEYKMVIPNAQGPFKWKKTITGNPDSLSIKVSGSQTLDIEVTPYYLLSNVKLTGSGTSVSGVFKLDKIITDIDAKDVDYVTLYINKTLFVSAANNIAVSTINGRAITNASSINLQVNVPAMTPTQNYVFARIGVKIAGVEDMIFSHVEKINL
ncbi:hypothetical protein AAKU52_001743 [Pedobacter sp. CG_S7]|uniref:DUF3823 domain-containing protein n=1 Tax=Pedobacter sp. CG_S7 TaxID=3143930 RepID=UPI0033991E6E